MLLVDDRREKQGDTAVASGAVGSSTIDEEPDEEPDKEEEPVKDAKEEKADATGDAGEEDDEEEEEYTACGRAWNRWGRGAHPLLT